MSMEQLLQLMTQTPKGCAAFASFAQQLIPVPKPQLTQPDSLSSPPVPPQDEQTNKEGEEEGRLNEAFEDLEEEELDFGEDSILPEDVEGDEEAEVTSTDRNVERMEAEEEGDVSEEDDVDLATGTGVVEEASFEHMMNRVSEDGEVGVAKPVEEPSIVQVQAAPELLEEAFQFGTDTQPKAMDSDNLATNEGDTSVIPEDIEIELGGNEVVIGEKDSEVPKETRVEDEQPAEATTKQIVRIPDDEEEVPPFRDDDAFRRWADPNTRLHRG